MLRKSLLIVSSLLLIFGIFNSCSEDDEEISVVGRWYLYYFTNMEASLVLPCSGDTYIELYIYDTGVYGEGCTDIKKYITWSRENNTINLPEERDSSFVKTEIVSINKDSLIIHDIYSNRDPYIRKFKSR